MLELDGNEVWDKFEFSYQSLESDSEQELELPFKLLVLGDFSLAGDSRPPDELMPIAIDAACFDRVLAAQNVELNIEVAENLNNAGLAFLQIQIPIAAMHDFHPQHLLRNVPYLAAYTELMCRLQVLQDAASASIDDFTPSQQMLLSQSGVGSQMIKKAELPFILCDLNERLYQMLDLILHHEQFQKLESIWRNLHRLVHSAQVLPSGKIELLDICQQTLMEDFVANRDVRESLLFDVVYFREFAQYGGQPYTALVGDYEFSRGAEDIQLLRSISHVCQAAHVPFIGGLSPAFFNAPDFCEDINDITEMVNGPRYIKWRGLQQQMQSSYIGLALPRIQLREGYQFASGTLGVLPYEENTRLASSKVLMGNASFAFAQCLIKSFQKYNICTQITGPIGGRVEGLREGRSDKGYVDYPLEVVFSEQKSAELSALGLMPLSINKVNLQLTFNSANSVRWGSVANLSKRLDASILDGQVEAQLPYLFVISRLAHYLKVVQRESVGSLKNSSELQAELNRWLRRYVADAENPAPSVRTRKPLKKAEVTVEVDPVTGNYEMSLTVVPHMKFLGNDFALALNFIPD